MITDKREDILKYIPQRPPMVMIHRLKEASVTLAVTLFDIEADNLFVEAGFLQESGLIENIAQTGAAMTGYHAIANQTEVKLGFIGAVKRLKIHSKPAVGQTIETHVKVTHEVFDYKVIKGEVYHQQQLMAECEMNIFIQPDEASMK